eukprot:117265-Amphidinium_carterae.1
MVLRDFDVGNSPQAKAAVLEELKGLPRTAVLRKMDNFAARLRRVKAHLCVVTHIRQYAPWL